MVPFSLSFSTRNFAGDFTVDGIARERDRERKREKHTCLVQIASCLLVCVERQACLPIWQLASNLYAPLAALSTSASELNGTWVMMGGYWCSAYLIVHLHTGRLWWEMACSLERRIPNWIITWMYWSEFHTREGGHPGIPPLPTHTYTYTHIHTACCP